MASSELATLMQRKYTEAGKAVAREVKLTEAGDQVLSEDPRAIYRLVKENLLSPAAVNQKLLEYLQQDCGVTSDDICTALAGR